MELIHQGKFEKSSLQLNSEYSVEPRETKNQVKVLIKKVKLSRVHQYLPGAGGGGMEMGSHWSKGTKLQLHRIKKSRDPVYQYDDHIVNITELNTRNLSDFRSKERRRQYINFRHRRLCSK